MTDDLCWLPATDALARFRARELSPAELLDAVLARRDEVGASINAFVWTCDDEARAAARAAEARYLGRGEAPRPLEGLPFAVKDETPVAGRPYDLGSLVYAGEVARETSPLAQRLLDAGVVLHGSTTTPEFSCAGFTHTRAHGTTRNPWSPGWAVGGSSGGAAAALAAGMTTLASGSDIGGSIRIPAAFCGVVGFKAPHGRVPVEPPFNLDRYCHNGALARTVADCALLHGAMAGPHPMDHCSLPAVPIPEDARGVEGMRLALAPGLGSFPLDPDVERAIRGAAAVLADIGAVVEEVDVAIPLDDLRIATSIHFDAIFGAWIAGIAREHPDLVMDYSAGFAARRAENAGGRPILDGLEREARIWDRLAPVLASHDAILCATIGARGFVAGDGYADHGIDVGGVLVDDWFDTLLTPVFNVAARCPVLVVPAGMADNGVPVGMQIAGRPYDDATPFRIGAALERARPWLDTPERRPSA